MSAGGAAGGVGYDDVLAAAAGSRRSCGARRCCRRRRSTSSSVRRVWFKCEHLQRVGAFKFRGAANAVFSLDDATASRGVAAHSSGNHAAALALAAQTRGIPCTVVMPRGRAAGEARGHGAGGCPRRAVRFHHGEPGPDPGRGAPRDRRHGDPPLRPPACHRRPGDRRARAARGGARPRSDRGAGQRRRPAERDRRRRPRHPAGPRRTRCRARSGRRRLPVAEQRASSTTPATPRRSPTACWRRCRSARSPCSRPTTSRWSP